LLICLAPQTLNDQVVRCLEPEHTLLWCQAEFAPGSIQLHKSIQAMWDGQTGYVNFTPFTALEFWIGLHEAQMLLPHRRA